MRSGVNHLGFLGSSAQALNRIWSASAIAQYHAQGCSSSSVLPRGVDPLAEDFARNKAMMHDIIQRLQTISDGVFKSGGATAVSRHHSRGKLLPRERISRILDEGSPFLELSPLAGHQLYGEQTRQNWNPTRNFFIALMDH